MLVPRSLYLATPEVGMPRRNQREKHPPMDLTPADIASRPSQTTRPFREPEDPYLRRLRQERQAAERQAEARRREGIDWSVCLVPGCGEDLRVFGVTLPAASLRDTDTALPLCVQHQLVAWRAVQSNRNEPLVIKTSEQLDNATRERWAKADAKIREAERADPNGEIYFVRINDLVKVGWTKTLGRRLKEYGAGAELLCHYPGTAADETALHRELRHLLAKGREWYHDGDAIQLYVRHAIERHGKPTAVADWTEPKAPMIRQRRRR